jgi:hypothetical protein
MSSSRRGATLERRAEPVPARPPRRAVTPRSAWTPGGLRVLIVVALLCLLLLWFAWYGCSRTVSWTVQVRWICLGVGACVVNALGCLAWLGVGVRSLRRERSRAIAELRSHDLMPRQFVPEAGGDDLVTGARMRRYHRADCPLMAAKAAQVVTAESAAARGLLPCGVCEP